MARLRTVQACLAVRRTAKLEFPSSSAEGVAYTIEISMVQGKITCTCPGFRFRGSCCHTQLMEEKCGWSSDNAEAEKQSAKQCSEHACPRCGSPTIEVVVPDQNISPSEEDSEADLRAKGVRVPMPTVSGRKPK
jgi:hypothetical protein